MSFSRFPRLLALCVLVGSLFVTVGLSTVSAALPTIAASPTTVPFDPTPGKAGSTQITVQSNDLTTFSICVSDNAKTPVLIQNVNGTSTVSFTANFIQAGSYKFFVSTTADCLNPVAGASVTVQRAGPNGLLGADDLKLITNGDLSISSTTTFPIGDSVCFMSGNGSQQSLNLLYGQDPRPIASTPGGGGLGAAAVDTTINGAVLGQNGCYPFNAVVNGFYRFSLGAAAQQFVGFCSGANPANFGPFANPPGIGTCAQIAFNANVAGQGGGFASIALANGTAGDVGETITGAIVTGADAHAVQVCVAVFSPNLGPGTTPIATVPNTVNAYNQSGAVNLTPIVANFPDDAAIVITTYDITNPGQPGGLGGAQFVCPGLTATQANPTTINGIVTPTVANATVIDRRFFVVT